MLDYGGGYSRRVEQGKYQFIELTNMHEEGSRGDKYNVELRYVDLNGIDEKTKCSAVRCCGLDAGLDNNTEAEIAYACNLYGAYANVFSRNGNNAHNCIRAARREANQLLSPDRLSVALSRSVNNPWLCRPILTVDSTALETMKKDVNYALVPPPGETMGLSRADVRVLRQSDLLKCKFFIFVPEHYRLDGTCKCDDLEHRKMMILEWGYSAKDFT